MWIDRELEYNVKVYLPRDAANDHKQVADDMQKVLLQHDKLLFNKVLIEYRGELSGSPRREILSAIVDFEELRKSFVDHYNGIVDELRVYYQSSKKPQKVKDNTGGVYHELEHLKSDINWLLDINPPLPVQKMRMKEACFYQPKQEVKKR